MSVRSFLTDAERTRLRAGWVLMLLGLTGFAVLARIAVLGGLNVALAVLMAVPAALAAWGGWLAFVRRLVVEVDADARSYVLIERGKRGKPKRLDELGPLVVSMRSRTVRTKNGSRTIIEYAVHPEKRGSLDFHVLNNEAQARRRLESLARAWRLPSRSSGGQLRAPDDLDKPLHERLRGDAKARRPLPLAPEWKLKIEPLDPGYAIVSAHRSWTPLAHAALLTVPTLVLLGMVFRTGVFSHASGAEADLADRVFLGLLAIVLTALLVKLALGARDTFFPGTIRVTPEGVSYRRSRLRFAEIEEVVPGLGVDLVGDRRTLKVPGAFCPMVASSTLAHEVQRLILEVGPTAGEIAPASEAGP